jgi:hypothetical protein
MEKTVCLGQNGISFRDPAHVELRGGTLIANIVIFPGDQCTQKSR